MLPIRSGAAGPMASAPFAPLSARFAGKVLAPALPAQNRGVVLSRWAQRTACRAVRTRLELRASVSSERLDAGRAAQPGFWRVTRQSRNTGPFDFAGQALRELEPAP